MTGYVLSSFRSGRTNVRILCLLRHAKQRADCVVFGRGDGRERELHLRFAEPADYGDIDRRAVDGEPGTATNYPVSVQSERAQVNYNFSAT